MAVFEFAWHGGAFIENVFAQPLIATITARTKQRQWTKYRFEPEYKQGKACACGREGGNVPAEA